MYVCMYVCTYVCMYVCMYVYIFKKLPATLKVAQQTKSCYEKSKAPKSCRLTCGQSYSVLWLAKSVNNREVLPEISKEARSD